MASVKCRPAMNVDPSNAVISAFEHEDGLRLSAWLESIRWFCYCFLFALLPFAINFVVALVRLEEGSRLAWTDIIQIPSLIFVGIFVCGTVLERLSAFRPATMKHDIVSLVGTFVYLMASILLAIAYTLCRDLPAGRGGASDTRLLMSILCVVCCIVVFSIALYWWLHYRDFSRREKGAVN